MTYCAYFMYTAIYILYALLYLYLYLCRPDEARISKMVFIGKNLDPEWIKASLLLTTVDPTKAVITMFKRA